MNVSDDDERLVDLYRAYRLHTLYFYNFVISLIVGMYEEICLEIIYHVQTF